MKRRDFIKQASVAAVATSAVTAPAIVSADTKSATQTLTNKTVTGYTTTINVRDYGAIGDGSDDTDAIQDALDTGYSVCVDDGYVFMATTLTAPAGTVMYGLGSIKQITDSSGPLITAAGSFSASEITLDGNRANQAVDRDILTVATGDIVLENVTINNASNRGIGGVCTTLSVTGGSFNGCDNYPIQVSNADTFSVVGTRIIYSSSDTPVGSDVRAIQPINCTNLTIHANYINTGRKYRDGIWINGGSDISIVGNNIKETADDQITLIGVASRVAIVGNTLRGSDTTSGVLLIGTTTDREDVTITGNIFEDHIACIDVRDTIGLNISDNIMRNSDEGVRLSSAAPSTNVIVSDNVIDEIANFGVNCGDSTNISVTGNILIGDASAGSIGVHGRDATDLTVSNNSIDAFEISVQTANGENGITGNHLKGATYRAIAIQSGNSSVIANNRIEDAANPITVVSAQGIINVIIQGNYINHSTLQSTANAINGGDVVDITMMGNIINNYNRPFVSAAGSDQGIYIGNNDRGCTLAPSHASMATSVVASNL